MEPTPIVSSADKGACEDEAANPMKKELGQESPAPSATPNAEAKEPPSSAGHEGLNEGSEGNPIEEQDAVKSEGRVAVKSEAAARMKRLQTCMVKALKKPSASEDAEAPLRHYGQLPRFSDSKRDLVEKWAKDKSYKWVAELRAARRSTVEQSSGSTSAYGNKWTNCSGVPQACRCQDGLKPHGMALPHGQDATGGPHRHRPPSQVQGWHY